MCYNMITTSRVVQVGFNNQLSDTGSVTTNDDNSKDKVDDNHKTPQIQSQHHNSPT